MTLLGIPLRDLLAGLLGAGMCWVLVALLFSVEGVA